MTAEVLSTNKARILLVIGVLSHSAGLLVYDSFPFLYLGSILILCCSYYLFLSGNGRRPLATPAFWRMAVVLAIPVIGVLAGIQKILVTRKTGDTRDRRSRLTTSLVSFLLFVPFVAIFAAMSMPAFPGAPSWLMTGILVCATVIEVAVLAAVIYCRRRTRRENVMTVFDEDNAPK